MTPDSGKEHRQSALPDKASDVRAATASSTAATLAPHVEALSVTATDAPSASLDSGPSTKQPDVVTALKTAAQASARDGSREREGAMSDGIDSNDSPDYIPHSASGGGKEGMASALTYTRPSEPGLPQQSLPAFDSVAHEPDYPSPSGGFVPPVTDETWALKDPPMASGSRLKEHFAEPSSASPEQPKRPTSLPKSEDTYGKIRRASSRAASRRGSSAAGEQAVIERGSKEGAVTRSGRGDGSGSGGGSRRTSARRSGSEAQPIPMPDQPDTSESMGASLGRVSSTSSNLSFLAGSMNSQAISARSSPSTVGPLRRPSSGSTREAEASEMQSADSGFDGELTLAPLKIRDYAYEEIDPRHVGARDVGLPSPQGERMSPGGASFGYGGEQLHEWGTHVGEDDEYDDDGSYEGSEGGGSSSTDGLPLGLYHAAYDFAAESEHELNVKVGERVRLVGHVDGGWAIVMRVREGDMDVDPADENVDKGLVPEAYLALIS